ncbi:tryptophan--tRNA ligase [Candidatus Nanosynbacter sp. HMT-352]|uniref:tryptophan--tRNA ligase n=1 Tax=Candidatus Nanosynbacter sp. HMT-352 TaxID=2899133 RepID=UPI001FB69F52|nr:tryptophan--tRNA ligase [Candidatus Nanosynbacter sp. HMT-352]UOG66146.1 tryptophan--tRNA ligase [Candidatus Nanosynbacter sp. HMT-352]
MKPSKPVILTGVRANNNIHIGNYFGAILPIINMAKRRSDEYDINLFIPDLHSFTTPIDHSKLYGSILNNARVYTAAGLPLDNPSIHLYRQSRISAHSELAWILDCFTGFGEMSRMTQFKDKGSKGDVSVGLFNYPVLMAADILLYGATYVPVGDDQTQHLEFTRDIAERMNRKFGDLFIVPKLVIQQHQFFGKDQGLRIKDLVNPAKKMSKSDESGKGIIFLSDDPKSAHKKIMSATTDSIGKVQYDKENQPGISNLLEILTLVRQDAGREVTLEQIANEYFGMDRYGDFKRIVADEVAEFLENFQNRLAAVDEQAIEEKLASSERGMNIVANETLYRVQKAVGLRK